jgi:signal transduction histidine kinase
MAHAITGARRPQVSLSVVAVVLVFLVALFAGGAIAVVHRIHGQLAHAEAAKTVLEEGVLIASFLAGQSSVTSPVETDQDWGPLSRLVNSFHTVQNGLQYVSIEKDGDTVFQEHTSAMGMSEEREDEPNVDLRGDVRLSRRVLRVGDQTMPVVVFSLPFESTDGGAGVVRVAMRKDAVGREEGPSLSAMKSMFRLTMATMLASFGLCAVLVVWMLHRETVREKQRRSEEHLAFSGVLANGIAHDFRNPMSSMRLDVQMLQKEVSKNDPGGQSKIVGLCSRIRGTMDRMDKVFQEFLYLSRPASDKPEKLDLVACVSESIEMLQSRLSQAGVGVETDYRETALHVMAYQGALRRALVNVITNAEHFSGKGGTVKLRVFRSGGNAVVDVADSGPGIPKGERRRIFEMFVTSRPSGTGLGLFLAKAAIERSGGSIRVIDSEDPGTCFRIQLPVAEDAGGDKDV